MNKERNVKVAKRRKIIENEKKNNGVSCYGRNHEKERSVVKTQEKRIKRKLNEWKKKKNRLTSLLKDETLAISVWKMKLKRIKN